MSIFTKADIEIERFTEIRKFGETIEDLYAHLEELKSQGIYVVDVTPISTRSYEPAWSAVKTYYDFMIRLIRPKYHVQLTVNRRDERTFAYHFEKSESLGFFKSAEEAEAIRKEYLSKDIEGVRYYVDIECFEPLKESI